MKNFPLKRTTLTLIPPIIWLIICTLLLTIPGSALPKEDWLSKIWFDKWVHISLFGFLVYLWCWFYFKTNKKELKRIFLLISILALLYGVGMEFVQKYFIPNRSFDGGDIIADGVGCIIGFLYSWRRYIKK